MVYCTSTQFCSNWICAVTILFCRLAIMSGSNMSDLATLETPAAEHIASEDMLKAELKGIHDATRFDWGDTDLANDGAANKHASEKDEFPQSPTQEDVEAIFDNLIEQVKADGVEGVDTDHCHPFAFSIKQLEYGDWPRRLFVHAPAGTGKRSWLANIMLWLKEVHEGVCHSNPAA